MYKNWYRENIVRGIWSRKGGSPLKINVMSGKIKGFWNFELCKLHFYLPKIKAMYFLYLNITGSVKEATSFRQRFLNLEKRYPFTFFWAEKSLGVAPWLIGYRESEVLLLKVKEWVAMERKIPRLSARNVTIPAVQRLECSVSNKKNNEGEERW